MDMDATLARLTTLLLAVADAFTAEGWDVLPPAQLDARPIMSDRAMLAREHIEIALPGPRGSFCFIRAHAFARSRLDDITTVGRATLRLDYVDYDVETLVEVNLLDDEVDQSIALSLGLEEALETAGLIRALDALARRLSEGG